MRISMLAFGLLVGVGAAYPDTSEFVCNVSVNGGPMQVVVARAASEADAAQVATSLYRSEDPAAVVDVTSCAPR